MRPGLLLAACLATLAPCLADQVVENAPMMLFRHDRVPAVQTRRALLDLNATRLDLSLGEPFLDRLDCSTSVVIIYDLPFLSRAALIQDELARFMARIKSAVSTSTMYLYTMSVTSNDQITASLVNELVKRCSDHQDQIMEASSLDDLNAMLTTRPSWELTPFSVIVLRPVDESTAIAMHETLQTHLTLLGSVRSYYTVVTTSTVHFRPVLDIYTKASFLDDTLKESNTTGPDGEQPKHLFDQYTFVNNGICAMIMVGVLVGVPMVVATYQLLQIQAPDPPGRTQ